MSRFFPRSFLLWAIITQSLSSSKILSSSSSSSSSWCQHHHIPQQTNPKFQQKTTIFWEFQQESKSWVQIKSPYDLLSCVNNNCTKVGIIEPVIDDDDQTRIELGQDQDSHKIQGQRNKKVKIDERKIAGLGSRNRISVTKMSDDSIWVTGLSGSIYERFWNGIQWVIAPHELPLQAGYAVYVFLVKHTVFALSEAGILYQMQLSENSQPIWVEFPPILDSSTEIQIKSGVISHNREKIYFCTKNGLLLELSEINTPRWMNHGKPPGANVAAIVDAAAVRAQVVFAISSTGDLYEFDPSSKPLWKKHIWSQESTHDTALTPITSCTAHRQTGPHSDSLFLLTKGGNLVERRLHKRKWKWVVHGSPKDQQLTSVTLVTNDEIDTSSFSLFLVSTSGSAFEYNISKQEGKKTWVHHGHPPHAKVAQGVAGLQLQTARLIFYLDDGRLGELHQSKTGGDGVGPSPPVNRRRVFTKYTWSVIDAPESEGWNAEYCTQDRGPLNCISGVKDESNGDETNRSGFRRRSGNKGQESYYLMSSGSRSKDDAFVERESSVGLNFRLRVMYEGQSFILVTGDGVSYEYLNVENAWFWFKHEHPVAVRGAVGSYNGSLFLVNENNDLIIGERDGNEFTWINGSVMKKGRRVIGGPPWDMTPSRARKVTPEDSLFFVSKTGGLLQLTVALKKLKWKDCRNPSNTKIASIVDQEVFRENIVFVVGMDGHLYQYNKVTGLWHGHHQSRHMVLSRQPGTAMRGATESLSGSIFMISEDGRLVEYYWNPMDGWGWVEHGSPCPGVTLAGSTGPCLAENQLFLIGSDGNTYLRYWDQTTWKWSDCGFPSEENVVGENHEERKGCTDQELRVTTHEYQKEEAENCDPKVAPTRPIPFTENSIIFELRDGRLAEMRRTENLQWLWWRTIGTPTTRCNAIYWTAAAS